MESSHLRVLKLLEPQSRFLNLEVLVDNNNADEVVGISNQYRSWFFWDRYACSDHTVKAVSITCSGPCLHNE